MLSKSCLKNFRRRSCWKTPGQQWPLVPRAARKDLASSPSMTLKYHSRAWSSKGFGHNSSSGFRVGAYTPWLKLSFNPPVPPLLDFVLAATATPYFKRSVERSATKNMEAPMTVGEKRYYWIVLILDDFKEDREKWQDKCKVSSSFSLHFSSSRERRKLATWIAL